MSSLCESLGAVWVVVVWRECPISNSRSSVCCPALTNEHGERNCSVESLVLVFSLLQIQRCKRSPQEPRHYRRSCRTFCNSQKTKTLNRARSARAGALLSAQGGNAPVKLSLPPACFQLSDSRFCKSSSPSWREKLPSGRCKHPIVAVFLRQGEAEGEWCFQTNDR